MKTDRTFPSSTLGEIGIVAALCALPGLILGQLVQGFATLTFGLAAAICGVVCGFVVTRLFHGRRAVAITIVKIFTIVVVACCLGLAVVALKPGFSVHGLLYNFTDALVHGWSTLATSTVPTFAEPRSLVPVTVVVFFAAVFASHSTATHRGPLLVLLAPTCAYLLALIAAGGHSFAAIPVGLAFVALCALLLGFRHGFRGDLAVRSKQQKTLQLAPATGVVVIAGIAALLVGPRMTFGREQQPFDVRNQVRPPELPTPATNPLELVSAQRQLGDKSLFEIRSGTQLYPQDLRLVALNHFDGASWTTTAPYMRSGAVLNTVARGALATSSIEATITITELDGPWVPSIADPVTATGVPLVFDPTSGSLARTDPVRNGLRYRLNSTRPEPRVEQLVLLPVGSNSEAIAALEVPAGIPASLSEMARTAIGPAQLPFQRAVELRNYLRASFTLDNAKAGGFSYGHLERSFVVDHRASDEQFAAMFATLGRVVGLPTRVVVGFTPPLANADGLTTVHGSDVAVWAEVLFEEVGWMPFTATPPTDGSASSSIGFGGQDQVELRPTPVQEAVNTGPLTVPRAESPLVPIGTSAKRSQFDALGGLLWLIASLLGIALVGLAAVGVLKRSQTAKRRGGTPTDGVLGAWQDVRDRLSEFGLGDFSTRTVEELVQATESSSAALAGLYRPVNRALYSNAEITEADREQAWKARDRFVASLNRKRSRRQRIVQVVNPRPLFAKSKYQYQRDEHQRDQHQPNQPQHDQQRELTAPLGADHD